MGFASPPYDGFAIVVVHLLYHEYHLRVGRGGHWSSGPGLGELSLSKVLQSTHEPAKERGRRGKPMRAEQTVSEMAQEVVWRQARARAQRTGEPLVEALEAVLQTPAGMRLETLRDGPHQDEEALYWQANLLFERVSEQAGHPV